MVVTLSQLYYGEKPTVILYTYYIVDRHAMPPNIMKHIIIYDNSAIEPYKIPGRGLGQQ